MKTPDWAQGISGMSNQIMMMYLLGMFDKDKTPKIKGVAEAGVGQPAGAEASAQASMAGGQTPGMGGQAVGIGGQASGRMDMNAMIQSVMNNPALLQQLLQLMGGTSGGLGGGMPGRMGSGQSYYG